MRETLENNDNATVSRRLIRAFAQTHFQAFRFDQIVQLAGRSTGVWAASTRCSSCAKRRSAPGLSGRCRRTGCDMQQRRTRSIRKTPLALVSRTLGHSNLATTGRYVHVRPEESMGKFLAI